MLRSHFVLFDKLQYTGLMMGSDYVFATMVWSLVMIKYIVISVDTLYRTV